MNIAQVRSSVATGLANFGQNVAQGAIWCGRKISYGFNTYIVPAAISVKNYCAPYFSTAGSAIQRALRSGWGVATLIGITALAVNEGAEQLRGRGHGLHVVRRVLHVAAIGLAVTATYFAIKFNTHQVF